MLKAWLKHAISSSADRPLLKYSRALVGRAGSFVIRAYRGSVVSFHHVDRQKIFDLTWEIKKTPGMLFEITTLEALTNRIFSFVHLDVDTYESTRDALQFFYPRMSPGGFLISHDYLNATGVRRAFDEYFADKPEPIVRIAETQCLIAKVVELGPGA